MVKFTYITSIIDSLSCFIATVLRHETTIMASRRGCYVSMMHRNIPNESFPKVVHGSTERPEDILRQW